MAKDHGAPIKDDEQYAAFRRQGASKEEAARVANTGRGKTGRRGRKAPHYEDWSRGDLYQRPRAMIEGRAGMNKGELIAARRHH